ncbi:hypothetical protein [Legionella sp.]|uniref:hypothetical protein n=1 Tax=Legionella sp. TaxID=459 RepID=UPI003CA8A169
MATEMTKKERVKIIDDFIENGIIPLRDKKKSIENKIKSTKDPEKEKIWQKQHDFIVLFEFNLIKELQKIKLSDYPTEEDFEKTITGCYDSLKNAKMDIKANRSLLRMLIEVVKSVTNDCFKKITSDKVQLSFFEPKQSKLDKINNAIEKLESLLDDNSHTPKP